MHTPLPDYEYRGLMAEAWDVLRGDTTHWTDRYFFLEALQRYGDPALDVGCGTGRLLLDFMQLGYDIDGVDNSPVMLALCRSKAAALGLEPRIYHQYIETLQLPRQYQTILIPSSTFQLIIEPAAAVEALGRLRAHLLPGGTLLSPFMALWLPGAPLEEEWERTATRVSDGAQFRRVAWTRYDPDTQLEETADLYQKIVDGVVVAEEQHRRSPATRAYTREQAVALFQQAGFQHIELFGDFTFEPGAPEDRIFVVAARS